MKDELWRILNEAAELGICSDEDALDIYSNVEEALEVYEKHRPLSEG